MVTFGVIGSSFLVSILLSIPFIVILGVAVWKITDIINTSDFKPAIIDIAERILGIFQDLFINLKIQLKLAVIGCFIGILAGFVSMFIVSTFAFFGLLIFGAMFVLCAIAFYILFNQDTTLAVIQRRIEGLHGTAVGRIIKRTVDVVGIVSSADGDLSVGQILKMILRIAQISRDVLHTFPILSIVNDIIGTVLNIVLRHSKRYALKAISNSFKNF